MKLLGVLKPGELQVQPSSLLHHSSSSFVPTIDQASPPSPLRSTRRHLVGKPHGTALHGRARHGVPPRGPLASLRVQGTHSPGASMLSGSWDTWADLCLFHPECWQAKRVVFTELLPIMGFFLFSLKNLHSRSVFRSLAILYWFKHNL